MLIDSAVLTPRLHQPLLSWALALTAVILTTALVYSQGTGGGFLLDDYPNIVTNPAVQPAALDAVSLKRAAQAYDAGTHSRPLATVTFAADYLWHGLDARAFKRTNLCLHLLNAILVLALLHRILRNVGLADARAIALSTITAILWATHPIQISTVLYVVQRMEILSLTFVLGALILYAHGRTRQLSGKHGTAYLVLSAIVAAIGLTSKETAALFPLYTLALEATLFHFRADTRFMQRALRICYLVAGIAAIAAATTLVTAGAIDLQFANRAYGPYERVLSQLRIVPMYLGQILVPSPERLLFYYDHLEHSRGWLAPVTTLFGGLLVLSLGLAAALLPKRIPLISLGIAWFLFGHVMTSGPLNLELAFEHRNYFALLGVMLAATSTADYILRNHRPSFRSFVAGIVVVGLCGISLIRSATWADPVLLAQTLAANNPDSPRAATELGVEYGSLSNQDVSSPFYFLAMREFDRASKLEGSSPLPEQGAILLAALSGDDVADSWWQSLIHKIETRPIGPQEVAAVTGLMSEAYNGAALDPLKLSRAYSLLLSRRELPPQYYSQYADYLLTYADQKTAALDMYIAATRRASSDECYAEQILGVLSAADKMEFGSEFYAEAAAQGLTCTES